MSEGQGRAPADPFPPSRVLVLCAERVSAEDRNLTQVLDFFGIPWKSLTMGDPDVDEREPGYAIVSSARRLVQAIPHGYSCGGELSSWLTKASSVYVHGFRNDERSTKLLRFLTGNPRATIRPIQTGETVMTVAEDYPAMCGPMSGLRVSTTLREPGCVFDVGSNREAFQSVIRADQGDVLLGVTYTRVRFYLSTLSRTIDIGALARSYFDVKQFFCETVPPIFYLKWAFRHMISNPVPINASLIVDDPPLKRRYGFLHFREALDLMDRHNFSTTIAFIPWNWRRTDPETLRLFQRHPKKLSLVVHGCNHTASEFAERSPAALNRMIGASKHRMESFRRTASCEADRVMVFPQGEFSPEAGRALKLNGFLAAVNTEVLPAKRAPNETTISDLWNVAIMRYGTFPIFTRRYAAHGIENFAFDGLLGKPCFIAAHHDIFRDHAANLVDLVARLNSLNWNLVWRPLGDAVRRSFAFRRLHDGTTVIQMFASTLVLENPRAYAHDTLLLKQEADPECVQAVSVNQKSAGFNVDGGHLRICLTTLPGETAAVDVAYRNTAQLTPARNSFRTMIKVVAHRHFSEFRDNYLSRNDCLYQGANRIKNLIYPATRR
jgi:hypothetical protein